MAITYVGGQVGGRAGSTSTSNVTFALTGGSDSTPQAGDLVVIGVAVASQARTPACAVSGYTAGTQQNANGTTYDTSLNKSYKFMGGTPDTTFTLPSTGNIADAQRYTVQVWRGVDPTNPFDVADVVATGTGTGRPNPGSITPTTSGAYVGIIGAGAAATGAAYTAPANYTTNFLTGSTADTNDAMIGSGYRSWTSGAEDPAAYTGGTTNAVDSWAAFTYALRPQGAVTHDTSGGLTGQGAAIVGSAARVGNEPILISTTLWQQDTLGTAASPGAKAITVPSDAQGVVIQFHAGSITGHALTVSSDFAGTFTVLDATGQNAGSIAYAAVTSTGAKNLTLSWTENLLEGPSVYISFIKNINTSDWVRDTLSISTETFSGSISTSIDSGIDDLILVTDEQDPTTPAVMTGCTSIATTGTTYSNPSRLQSVDSPGSTTTSLNGNANSYATMTAIAIKPPSGPVTHATTGALTGQGATVSGSAQHLSLHTTTGALVGQGAAVTGAAARFRAHDATGGLTGAGAAITGSAARSAGAVTHDTSGALVGQGPALASAASRFRTFSASGALVGQGSTITGSGTRYRAMATSGALTGQGAAVAGTAQRFRAFGSTGALTGQGAAVAGTARHNTPHATSGALTGSGASLTGTAARTRAHDTTGVLSGPGASLAGTATHNIHHATSGALTGPGAVVVGAASRNATVVTHDTAGALAGPGSALSGSANRYRQHNSSGALAGQGSALSGSANRYRQHNSSGALAGPGSTVAGAANRFRAHDSTGSVIGPGAQLSGAAARTRDHQASGSLAGTGSTVSGTAQYNSTHATSGALVGQGSTVSGNAQRNSAHGTTGVLIGPGALVVGAASLQSSLATTLSEAAILAIVEAIWTRQLPLGAPPVVTYGAVGLSTSDLDAISRAVWSRSLP